jgi:hypothetical protein
MYVCYGIYTIANYTFDSTIEIMQSVNTDDDRIYL